MTMRKLIAEAHALHGNGGWGDVDVADMIRRKRSEQTVSGNVGAFTVPLGGKKMLRRVFPNGAQDNYNYDDEYDGIYRKHYDD